MPVEIVRSIEIRFGKPVIKGTRISVYDILEALKNGWTIEEISNEYKIPKEAVIKAIEFAEEKLKEILFVSQ